MWCFMFHMSKFTSFPHFSFNLLIDRLTSCHQLMASTRWPMLSLPMHSNIFDFESCFILWGDHNSDNPRKRRTLPQSTPNVCMYVFLPFATEVLDRLHQQANIFFHQSNDMEWSTKCSSEPPLAILHAFYKQRVSIALEILEATFIFIFRHVVIEGESYFGLSVLSGVPSPFLLLLYAPCDWWGALEHDLFQCPFDRLWVLLF